MREILKIPLAAAVGIALLAAGMGSLQANNEASKSFWRGGNQGWWFYNEVQEAEATPAEEVKPEPAEPTTQVHVVEPPEQAPLPDPDPPIPATASAPLSAEWFRVNLPKYRDAAWDNPTVENVQTYMYLQRFVMDRSEQFADAAELATLGHPWLDEANRRPTQSSSARRLTRAANSQRNASLDALSERAGIFFFYDSECFTCLEMQGVISMLQDSFAVIPVSMDGKDLPGNPFPDFRPNDGHAEKIGVTAIPSLYLASPEGEFAPFAHGPVSLSDARHRMVVAARRMGWITEQEFNATRPVRNLDQDLSNVLAFEDLAGSAEDNFIEPSEVLRRIKETIGVNEEW